MVKITALADIDAQVLATGTAMVMSAVELDDAISDLEFRIGHALLNPLIWPTILSISANAVILSVSALG